jgi:hypothetical protein
MMLHLLHMLCLLIELCLSNLACLYIILILLVGIRVKGTILALLVIIVVLVVIFALTAFNYALRSLRIKSMYLGKMSLVLKIKSGPYVIKLSSSVKN